MANYKIGEDKKSPYVPIKALPDGKPMIVHSPIDSVMYKVLSDTTAIKQRAAVLDSIRTGKLDPKVYNERIKKQSIKKEGEMTEQVKEAFIGMASNKVMSLKKLDKAQKVLQGAGTKLEKGNSVNLAKQILKAKRDGNKLEVQKLQQQFSKNAGIGLAVAAGGTALWAGAKVLGKIFKKKPGQIINRVKAKQFREIGRNRGPAYKVPARSVGTNIPKVGSIMKTANMSKMKSLVDTGLSAEDAAKAAYPNATPDELGSYVSKYKSKKKKGKLYVDKVVLKKASLLQRAASKLNFSKIANATLGYRGNLPQGAGVNSYAGGNKQPNQVGSVIPTAGNRGNHA